MRQGHDGTRAQSGLASPEGEPRTSPLRRIVEEHPEARARLGRAVALLLGTSLFALAAIGALLIWHLVRRGRLIRDRLSPPRDVWLPQLSDRKVDRNHDHQGNVPTA